MQHKTVLLHEAVDGLVLSPNSIVVDTTLGSGGHAREIISQLDKTGTYIGIDADETALTAQAGLQQESSIIHLVNGNFKNLKAILSSLHIKKVDAILADLGWRMEQFSGNGKGFSFSHDEPLVMTYGDPASYDFTAYEIVNEWQEESIADIIFGYGEERQSRPIAKAIVTAREEAPIKTTGQLADVIKGAIPKRFQSNRIHPATKTFQALRIAVNDELGVIETLINDGFEALNSKGRIAVITFHSLEDRIVKHKFRELADAGLATRITKKPIIATPEEVEENPRARSAKLRILEKI